MKRTHRTHRTRPIRVSKNKQHTVTEPATLLDWIQTYPMMTVNARCWFANWQIPHDEIRQVYEAGFHGVALSLGYTPYARPELVDFSQPIIVTHERSAA